MNEEITQELLHLLIDYDPETGVVVWKPRLPDFFEHKTKHGNPCKAWNTQHAGKQIGSLNSLGYLVCRLFNKKFGVHRLIWIYMTGQIPKIIDHINGIRSDNRFINLRNTTTSGNGKNRVINSNNISGYMGISLTASQKWQAVIKVNGKLIILGTFDTKKLAVAARKAAEIKFGFHSNHGRKSNN